MPPSPPPPQGWFPLWNLCCGSVLIQNSLIACAPVFLGARKVGWGIAIPPIPAHTTALPVDWGSVPTPDLGSRGLQLQHKHKPGGSPIDGMIWFGMIWLQTVLAMRNVPPVGILPVYLYVAHSTGACAALSDDVMSLVSAVLWVVRVQGRLGPI